MDPSIPTTLWVMESGEYLVTILPIQDETGIFSGMQFLATHSVDAVSTTEGL